MPAITIEEIQERLRQLPPDKLALVFDFVSYLADRQAALEVSQPTSERREVLRDDLDIQAEESAEENLSEAGMSQYLMQLEEYEDRLARHEIDW